jgi:nitrous oxide reductase accessory protein NosL
VRNRGTLWLWRFVAVLVAASLLAACGGDDEQARLEPPEIEYNVDISEMGMAVVDPRYTAAALPEGEDEWILFDDNGELLKFLQNNPDMPFDVIWVHDYNDESWVRAEDAWYLESPELTTSPMGWGVATFKDEGSARAAQKELGGDLFDWEAVQTETWDQPPGPHHH